MQRENRYTVLKNKDIASYLNDDEQEQLDDLCRKINRSRLLEGKEVVQCVVVEHDCPEYEPTWNAIEKRVKQAECEHKWEWWPIAGEGQVCKKCSARNFDCDD